jgi:hypothetical protein
VEIRCTLPLDGAAVRPLQKSLRFAPDGRLTVSYEWDPAIASGDDLFAPEISLFRPLSLQCEPAAELWTFPIETVAKSERGLDRTLQGESITPRWRVAAGAARIEIGML